MRIYGLMMAIFLPACASIEKQPKSFCSTSYEMKSETGEILSLINQERIKKNLRPLRFFSNLACAAQKHADDLSARKTCSHYGKDGSNFVARAKQCGYAISSGGEIVACGHKTARAAVDGWLGSSGHYAIMMNPKYAQFGSGFKNNYRVVVFSK